MNLASLIIPIPGKSNVTLAIIFYFDIVETANHIYHMFFVLLPHIFHAKIVNYECERQRPPLVCPYPRCKFALVVPRAS